MLLSVTQCYSVLLSVIQCYSVLLSVTQCYSGLLEPENESSGRTSFYFSRFLRCRLSIPSAGICKRGGDPFVKSRHRKELDEDASHGLHTKVERKYLDAGRGMMRAILLEAFDFNNAAVDRD